MPVLPAASYQPVQAPSVEPASTAGTPYQSSAAATPEAFGGYTGAALTQLGRQADAASDSMVNIQNVFNQYAAQGATNHVADSINRLIYGDPDTGEPGFNALRGQNAMTAWPVIRKQLDQAIQDSRKGLQNPAQQLRFDQETQRLRDWALSTAGRHYDAEFDRWQNDTAQATTKLDMARGAAAAASGDQAAFDQSARQTLDNIDKQGTLQGRPREAIDAQKQAALQIHAIQWADGKAARGDAIGALQTVEANREVLGADKYEALTKRYQPAAKAQQIDDFANGRPYTPIGNTGAPMVRGGAVQNRISDAAAQAGVSNRLALTTASIESSMGQNLGSRGNIFQLGQPEWAASGGGRMGDPDTDIRNGVTFLANTKQQLAGALGREPTDAETYLAHQQGVGGAAKLLANPGTPAGQLVPARNISGNGGDPNAPASAFVAKWTQTFDNKAAQFDGAGSLASSQITPESGGNFSGGGPAPAAPIMAVGDSIAAHLVRKAGAGGQESGKVGTYNPGDTAVSGYNPSEVLTLLSKIPDSQVQGKTVILSTGTSNDPTNQYADIIPAQIATLRSKGAANVVVMGTGTKYADRNDQLAKIAADSGATFSGPLRNPAGDGIHSSNPAAELAAAQSVLPTTGPAPATQTTALRPDSQIPGLLARIDEINRRADAAGVPDDIRAGAVAKVRQQLNGAYTDELRARQAEDRAKAQEQQAAENEVIADKYSGQPKITSQMIANDPRLTPAAKQSMLKFIQPDKVPVDPVVSHQTEMQLMSGIADRTVTDTKPIFDAYNAGTLSDEGFNFVMKQKTDAATPAGVQFAKRKDEFLKSIEPQIDKSALAGIPDLQGKERMYRYTYDLDQKVDEYKKAGKNPGDLLDPSKPDYAGKPESVRPYMNPLSLQMLDAQAGASSPGVPALDLSTKDKVVAAYRSGKIDRAKATDILTRNGWASAAPAAPAVPTSQVPVR